MSFVLAANSRDTQLRLAPSSPVQRVIVLDMSVLTVLIPLVVVLKQSEDNLPKLETSLLLLPSLLESKKVGVKLPPVALTTLLESQRPMPLHSETSIPLQYFKISRRD